MTDRTIEFSVVQLEVLLVSIDSLDTSDLNDDELEQVQEIRRTILRKLG